MGIKILTSDSKHTAHDILLLSAPATPDDPLEFISDSFLQRDNSEFSETHPLLDTFYSVSPYSFFDDKSIKYRVLPACDSDAAKYYLSDPTAGALPVDPKDQVLYLIRHAKEPVSLLIQMQCAPTNAPSSYASSTLWQTSWETIGRLVIQSEFKGHDADAGLKFNPFNVSGVQHLPLGRMNRIRGHLYQQAAAKRSEIYLFPYKAPKSTKVCIIGGGAAGLSCALALAEFGYKVTVLEKKEYVGGHAATGVIQPAFGAFTELGWPNLWRLLKLLGVDPVEHTNGLPTDTNDWFDSCFVGWHRASDGKSLGPMSPSVRNEGQRFVAALLRDFDNPKADEKTIRDLVDELDLSNEFLTRFLMGGVIQYFGGMPLSTYLEYPVRLVAWMWLNNAAKKSPGEKPMLYKVDNATYMDAFAAHLAKRGVTITTGVAQIDVADLKQEFGHIVMAVQPHLALSLLGPNASHEENKNLMQFSYTIDEVIVHRDFEGPWMPSDRSKWKVHNLCLLDKEVFDRERSTVPVTIWHRTGTEGNVLATYYYKAPRNEDFNEKIVERRRFTHISINPKTQRLRSSLHQLQQDPNRCIYFCGSWTRGFTLHEDAIVSGYNAANLILGKFNREFSILPAAVPQPISKEKVRKIDHQRVPVTTDRKRVLARVVSIVENIMPSAATCASIDESTSIASLAFSSLEFARLANELGASAGKSAGGVDAGAPAFFDITTLFTLDTIGDIVDLWIDEIND